MTTIAQVNNAYALCQEYTAITTMLATVGTGSFTLYATISPGTQGQALGQTAQVTVAQATLTTLLQNRQAALASQLAAMGITPT